MDNGEIRDIAISWLVVSVAFGWVMKGGFQQFPYPLNIGFAIIVAMIAVGTGFILHELAHRTIAIRFGAKARYVAWPFGLVFALFLALFSGFVFAAPGAVYIFGRNISKEQNGLISLAGPATNIATAVIFIIAAIILRNGLFSQIASVAAFINLWLGTFNLIPLFPLDGSKVFAWKPLLWAAIFFPLAAITLLFMGL